MPVTVKPVTYITKDNLIDGGPSVKWAYEGSPDSSNKQADGTIDNGTRKS
jgi:hypothetical protein